MSHVIDFKSFHAPQALIDRIAGHLAQTGSSAQEAFRCLSAEIDLAWPGGVALGRAVVKSVDDNGFAVADNLGIADLDPAVRDVLLLSVLRHVGDITGHDDDARVLWDIKDRAAGLGRAPTFSERLGECPIHTDSAFAADPERFLCLYVVRESADGGGESVVISMDRAIEELLAEPEGRRCAELLRGEVYPFRTPDAFSSSEVVVKAPILGDSPVVRFRHDSVVDGFSAAPELDTPERRWAVDYFFDFVEKRASRLQFLGTRDQLVVVDNRRSLHARTDYADPRRHLIRARLRPHAIAA